MSKSQVNIIDFPVLYNILFEIKDFLNFEIFKYENENLFLEKIKKEAKIKNYIILAKNSFIVKDINQKSIIYIDDKPITFVSLIDKINSNLLKQKFNLQSKISIKDYFIDLNSRVISKREKKLKLTEREVEIILFLHDKKKPQKINVLQKEVWSYSTDLETHTVETHIYRLRKKISDEFNDNNFILSLDAGYSI